MLGWEWLMFEQIYGDVDSIAKAKTKLKYEP